MAVIGRDGALEVLLEWNTWGKETATGIERSAYVHDVERKVKAGEVVVLGGVRRAGKSTIGRQCIERRGNAPETLVVNCEDPRLSGIGAEGLMRLYDVYLSEMAPGARQFVFLDEVQAVDGWEKFVRFLHDKRAVDVVVTGSSSKLLSGEYATLLTGRHVDVPVFPLSFSEFLGFQGLQVSSARERVESRRVLQRKLREYLEFGGFPKPVTLGDDGLKKELLSSYFGDILHRDVGARHAIRETGKLEELGRYYLANNARLASFNRLKNMLGLSLDSVERFSRYLEEACLVSFAPIFSYSTRVQVANPRKAYAVDTGMRNAVSFRFSKDFGWNAENAAFLQLKRGGFDVFYHRDNSGECDLIARKGSEVHAIQVAWDLSDIQREKTGLERGMAACGAKEGWLLTQDDEGDETAGKRAIHTRPLWKWLLAGFE